VLSDAAESSLVDKEKNADCADQCLLAIDKEHVSGHMMR
jgi:hypothetical protein